MGKGFPSGVVKVASLVVPHDPNDFEISVVRRIQKGPVENVHLDSSAERVFVRKILANKSLIYDHNLASSTHIVFGEQSAANQRPAEHLEITFANRLKCGLPTFRVRLAGNDRVAPFVLQRGFLNRFGNGDHAGKSTKPVEDLPSEGIFLLPSDIDIGVICLGQRETKVENVLGIETQVHACQHKKAAHQEASAHQQDDRESNLANHQRGPQFAMTKSRSNAFAAAREPRLQVAAHRVESRGKTAQDRRQKRYAQC